MMEGKSTREEMNEKFIEDQFFESGHIGLKLRQIGITILAWISYFIPFGLVLFPILFLKERVIIFAAFDTAIRIFRILDVFLLIAIIFIIIYFLFLTHKTNKYYSERLQKKITYNEENLKVRESILEDFFAERFGEKTEREAAQFVSIPEEKNLDENTIRDLYREKGAPLK
ncbi:hypothetical protein BI336_01245 [Listeria monocytogenes]|nr:hypothetical protein [Listeria monocytogenes]EAD3046379.1 hypothetical protein [Listeria monocytogenes]EAE7092362.1 hypothetical protein [Listeria monocytogenes]